jgi:hypothetical protein
LCDSGRILAVENRTTNVERREVRMKRTIHMVIAGLVLSSTLYAYPLASDHEKKKAKYEPVSDSSRSVSVHVAFVPSEVRVIREYYGPRYRSLPPGLQKKYRRTGQLPPGWQKRMEPFPLVVERQLAVLPAGYQRGVIDGHAVIYNPRTQVIFDIAVLF